MSRRRGGSGWGAIVLFLLALAALNRMAEAVGGWEVLLTVGLLGVGAIVAWLSWRGPSQARPAEHQLPPAEEASAEEFELVELNTGGAVNVSGAYFYEQAIAQVAGPMEEGASREMVAQLRPEPRNPHDANAIAVHILGQKVGHLPREIAAEFAPLVNELLLANRLVQCPAVIVAGRDRRRRGRGDGDRYGVQLRLAPIGLAREGLRVVGKL